MQTNPGLWLSGEIGLKVLSARKILPPRFGSNKRTAGESLVAMHRYFMDSYNCTQQKDEFCGGDTLKSKFQPFAVNLAKKNFQRHNLLLISIQMMRPVSPADTQTACLQEAQA